MKRILAMLLCLSMVLCVLPAQLLTPAEAATYVYNWGAREDTATTADFTRSTAEEWYAKYNTSYEALSQLAGSKTQSSVPSSAMYKELQSLMKRAHGNINSYNASRDMFKYTDCQNGGGKISSFYSGTAIGPAWGEGNWNREHTWPNSKGLGGSDEDDIMMLRPTATSENSSRGNTAYGESYYDPNDASGGKYNLHGDVARICLYVYVRWGNTSYMWGAAGVMESRATLLKWMEEDPVDTWELGRNDAVQSITGTRNVFVDYPELGFLLFGEDVPAGYESPSNSGSPTSYSITATSNNTSYGTVSLSGKTITASPKTGYYAASYTVTSGSAQVTQNGNTFQVTPSSDCTIRINFAAKTNLQVKFSENGVIAKTVSAYAGDSLTLPNPTKAVPEGCTFLGWMESSLQDTTQKPTFLKAGTAVTAANKTYYALYTYSVGGTGTLEYVKKDISEIRSGDAFVITMTKGSTVYALPNTAASTGPISAKVTAADGKLTGDVASNLLWNLGGSSNAWSFYPNGTTARWLSCTGKNNGVRVDTGSDKTFKISGNYLVNIGTGRYVGVYETNPDWRCYTSSSINIDGQTLGFYVKSESGISHYTTQLAPCAHENAQWTDPVEATCLDTGYTAGLYCSDCETYVTEPQEIPALGHTWGEWFETKAPTCTAVGEDTAICEICDDEITRVVPVIDHSYTAVVTPPTGTAQGYTTYTCTACGHSYVGAYVAPAVAEVNGNTYETLAAAIQAAKGSTVKLLGDCEATVTGAAYLDLNGYTAQVNADKLYVMDSTATTAAAGAGRLITESQVATQWNDFVTLDNGDGYTAHKLELRITAVTLRTAKAGIYYKASLACDPTLRARIGAYGVALSVDEGAQLRTCYQGAPTGEFTSGSVFNIFKAGYSAAKNAQRGELEIYANAYIQLQDGTVITDNNGTAQSLRDVLERLNEDFNTLTAAEKTQLKSFYTTWQETLSRWDLSNLAN